MPKANQNRGWPKGKRRKKPSALHESRVEIRLPKRTKDRWQRWADDHQMSLSEFIVKTCELGIDLAQQTATASPSDSQDEVPSEAGVPSPPHKTRS